MATVQGLRRRRAETTLLGALASSLLVGPAVAAEWEFETRLAGSETWTDNISLAADGDEVSEWVTELRPGFTVSGEGPRIDAQLDYDAQALWFADNSDLNDVFHDANGQANFELVERSLFLDGYLRFDQQNIDPRNRVAYSNLFNTGNRADTFVFGLSPYHVGRWGDWGESLLRIQRQDVRYSGEGDTEFNLQDAEITSASFELGSPQAARGFSWRARASTSETDFDTAPGLEYDRVSLDLGIPVGLRARLTLTGGQESDVSEDQTAGGLDADFWYVGMEWSPSELQELSFRIGDRYYGSAYEFHWARRGSRGDLSVDYTEEPTTASGVLADEGASMPGFGSGGLPSLDTRVFLSKRLEARASYEFTRSTLSARLYSARREIQDEFGGTERNSGATLNFDWQSGPRMTIGTRLNWERREFAEDDREDDFGEVSVRLNRELTRILSAELSAGHLFRDSEGDFDYSANRVTLSLLGRF